jgi:hypothetical protein
MKSFKQLIESSEESPQVWEGIHDPNKSYFRPAKKEFTNSSFLSSEEQAHVHNYSDSGHNNINKYHRFPGSIKIEPVIKSIERHTKHIDSAISKSTAKNHMHLWRGTEEDVVKDLKPGDTFHDNGYVSTSMSPQVSWGFAGYHNKEIHLMHIKTPKGSKVLDLEHHGATANKGENEFLLPRGSKFRYDGKTSKKGKIPDGSTYMQHVHHLTYLGQHEDV